MTGNRARHPDHSWFNFIANPPPKNLVEKVQHDIREWSDRLIISTENFAKVEIVVIRRLLPDEMKLAQRFDGHAYQLSHKQFHLDTALQDYLVSGHWDHLSEPEAQATFSLLAKALEIWERSKYKESEELDKHYDAFHSLYQYLQEIQNSPEP